MTKRLFDVVGAAIGLLIVSPILLVFVLAVWLQDFRSPFYVAERVGVGGKKFNMVKLRSMVVSADGSGSTSTSDTDNRITPVGKWIRKLKLDEITQLWNVLMGDMSLVGPRPNVVKWGVELYTGEEMRLLSVRPGITDFASVVFADEGAILKSAENPDLVYNQIIRPWKSRLSLVYVDHRSSLLDMKLIFATLLSAFNRSRALSLVCTELRKLDVPAEIVNVAARNVELKPYPPPGSSRISDLSPDT